MPGVATPPLIVQGFGYAAAGGTITTPLPLSPQTGGHASYATGFPAATMEPTSSGGINPFGQEMNGVLFAATANIAALTGGQLYQFSATWAATNGGYALGAVLQQAANALGFWVNLVNGNSNNPDTGGSGWQASPIFSDPRSYGADPTGVADSTIAVQTAINVALAVNGMVWIGDGCNYLCGALTATFTGSRNTNSLTIMGASPVGSRFTQNSSLTSGALLTCAGGSGATPIEANLKIANVGLYGNGSNIAGLLLQNIAEWSIENVIANTFLYGIQLSSALIGELRNCVLDANVNGLYARLYSGGAYNNLVNILGGRIVDNTTWGIDYGAGQGLHIDGVDIEQNGTSGNAATGGVILRSTISAETGVALMSFYKDWFEGNYGWGIYAENTAGLQLMVRDTLLFGAASGTSGVLNVQGAQQVTLDNIRTSALATDAVLIGASAGAVDGFSERNSTLVTLTDNSSYPAYEGALNNSGNLIDGRQVSQSVTMTGGSTATGSFYVKQQGLKVTIIVPSVIENSSGSSATISIANAVPAACYPSVVRGGSCLVYANGASVVGQFGMDITGTLTLALATGGTFTASQANGLAVGQFSYDR